MLDHLLKFDRNTLLSPALITSLLVALLAGLALAVATYIYRRREVDAILGSIRPTRPLNILVLGMQHHGKSSLVNTLFRVVKKQQYRRFLFVAETSMSPDTPKTVQYKRYPLLSSIALFDSPAIDSEWSEDAKRRLLLLLDGVRDDTLPSEWGEPVAKCAANKIHAVVLVVSAQLLNAHGGAIGGALKEVHDCIKAKGVPYGVAVTNMDRRNQAPEHPGIPGSKRGVTDGGKLRLVRRSAEDMLRYAKQATHCDNAVGVASYTVENTQGRLLWHTTEDVMQSDMPVSLLLERLVELAEMNSYPWITSANYRTGGL